MSDARTPSSPGRGGQHDFVDRLVSKAFGARDAAAPRLPSAFEPTASSRTPASGRRGDDDARGTLHGTARGQGALDPFSDASSHQIDELDLHALDADAARGHHGGRGRGDTRDADASGTHASGRGEGAFDLDDAMRDAILRASSALGSSSAPFDAGDAQQSVHAASDDSDHASTSSAASAEERDAAAAARLLSAQHAASRLGSSGLADLAGLAAFADRADPRGRLRRHGGDADAGDSTHAHADGEGTLGRSPFDARANAAALAEAAARAIGRDAASLERAHDRHESAAHRHARGADADRHDADSDARDTSARRAAATLGEDVRALEGALLSRDRGLAQRLAQAATAARGGDRATRRGSGGDGLDQEAVTVNVTIGRIDVRAVHSTAAAAPRGERARGPQPVALDDYLAQRGGAR